MSAVKLSRPLALEEPQRVADGAGGFSVVWVALGTLWAEVLPGSGRKVAGEELMLAAVPYRITVRGAVVGSAARPKPDQRFRDGARVFTILAVTERDPAGHHLLCFAREEVPA